MQRIIVWRTCSLNDIFQNINLHWAISSHRTAYGRIPSWSDDEQNSHLLGDVQMHGGNSDHSGHVVHRFVTWKKYFNEMRNDVIGRDKIWWNEVTYIHTHTYTHFHTHTQTHVHSLKFHERSLTNMHTQVALCSTDPRTRQCMQIMQKWILLEVEEEIISPC